MSVAAAGAVFVAVVVLVILWVVTVSVVVMAVVVAMVAAGAMHVWGCCHRDADGLAAGWRGAGLGDVVVAVSMIVRMVVVTVIAMVMRVPMSVRMPTCGIGATFGFERGLSVVHDQVHGAQHVC